MNVATWLIVTVVILGRQATPPRPTDYKAVFWYRRDQPIETFKYQVYDVRKGEYTSAVVDWTRMMRKKYPAYEVSVRDVDLDRERGPTEARKVGSVVHRELLAAAAAVGVFVGPIGSEWGVPTYRRPSVLGEIRPARVAPPYSPLGPMFNQNALPNGFPVPTPYPRPHP